MDHDLYANGVVEVVQSADVVGSTMIAHSPDVGLSMVAVTELDSHLLGLLLARRYDATLLYLH
jgi:hypothetical protein